MSRTATDGATDGTTSSVSEARAAPLDWATFYNSIDGQLQSTAETRHGTNPVTGKPGPEVPLVTREGISWVMEASHSAFQQWPKVPWEERKAAFRALADALEAEREGFTRLIIQEQGKTLPIATMELKFSLEWLRIFADFDCANNSNAARCPPWGVTLGLVQRNFSIFHAVGIIAPTVLAGNTVIIKPSISAPACCLKLCELGQRFFPPGVIQCISGDDRLGLQCIQHPIPVWISFAGSESSGAKVHKSCDRDNHQILLELGVSNPYEVVHEKIKDLAPEMAGIAFDRAFKDPTRTLSLGMSFAKDKRVDKPDPL